MPGLDRSGWGLGRHSSSGLDEFSTVGVHHNIILVVAHVANGAVGIKLKRRILEVFPSTFPSCFGIGFLHTIPSVL